MVVTHSGQRCDVTALVGTPCATSALAPAPLELTSATFEDASWHIGHDIGFAPPGATDALEELALN